MNARFFALIAGFFLLLSAFSPAATITGTVFDAETLEPAQNAIVSINSKPVQTMVAKDARFSFNVPEGTYSINASLFENGFLVADDEQQVRISSDGNFVIDLVLFPVLDSDLNLSEFLDDLGNDFNETDLSDLGSGAPDAGEDENLLYFGMFAALVVMAVAFFLEKKKKKEKKSEGRGKICIG
ncbi:MAG: hypothetical protein V1494_02825 [Candidatus Diapherotrites archaeon]